MPTVSRHLARLGAQSRPSGSGAADEARTYCAAVLEGHGFATRRLEFSYSKFPGSWAAPMAGFFMGISATALFCFRHREPAILDLVGVAMLALVFALLAIGSGGVLWFPMQRARGVNLEATRGPTPQIWLIAHIDSKWQPVSMIVRVLGVLIGAPSLVLVAILALTRPDGLIGWFVIATWLGAIPLMLSVVGARNHGTLDNASGVATVLEALDHIPREQSLGVLISDAEELALAGARAWLVGRDPATALNVDSVDDDGALVGMFTGSAPGEIVSVLRQAAEDEGEPLKVLRLIPGILTDSVPLAGAGWRTLTLSRGTIRTLQRIHTSRDTLEHMDGRGIESAARVLARTVTELS